MTRLLRSLRMLGWLLSAAAVAVLGVYLAALLINRHDRPPSIEARQLDARLERLPEVPDEDNAYLYLLGFAAPPDADPRAVGARRADWIRSLRSNPALPGDSDPYFRQSLGETWKPEQTGFVRNCWGDGSGGACFAALSSAGQGVETWLAEQQWVLARYQTLLSYPSWRGIYTGDQRLPFPPYPLITNLLAVRNVWFFEAWARAARGDAEGVRAALGADLEFWRRVLSESQTMFMKMLAAGMIEDHFARSTTILKRLSGDEISRAVPASWRDPISSDERSLRRVFAFELRYSRSMVEMLRAPANPYAAWTGHAAEPRTLTQRISEGLARPLLQEQDFLNKRAHFFTLISNALDAPYERIPDELDRAYSEGGQPADSTGWNERLYNLVGDLIREAVTGAFEDYGRRVSDIEGVRRAALLVAELRSRGLEVGEIAAAVANAELRNPYTHNPFRWDPETGAVVFDGIAHANQGRHAFWY